MAFQAPTCSLKRRDFLTTLGPEKLSKLGQMFGANKAVARTIFALKVDDKDPVLFSGEMSGQIVDP